MGVTTQSIRNIAVAGHGSTGKTTLVEHMLAASGVIPKPETVESGKTVSDWTDEEIARTISVHASLSHLSWKDTKINILDTPGSADFVGEVIAALRVSEAALVLVGAESGAQIETIKLWRRLEDRSMPRVVFLNKMDKEHADFESALSDLREKFQGNFVPITIPIGAAAGFSGIINLLDQKAYMLDQGASANGADIPADMQEAAQEQRVALVEAAAEGNDTLMEKYLEEENLTGEEIAQGLREALAAGKCVPVFCGSATGDSGVAALLDFIADSFPSPGNTETALDNEGNEVELPVTSEGDASCFVFKTSVDQFSGQLSYIKVMTGVIGPEIELVNNRDAQKARLSKVFSCQGKKLVDTDSLPAGDLGVLTKMEGVRTADTLSVSESMPRYVATELPQPVHSVAVSAASKKDEDKLNQLLQREALEDPTFQVEFNNETKETVVSCMGELHLSIVLDKIKDKQKIEVETRVPKVPYRETLRKPAAAEYQHKKQTGGHGQYAKVVLEIAPLPRGEQFKFVNAIFGGAVSKGYIPGVEKGILEGMESGILAGYPVVDLEAKIVDGKEHPVDSSEMAFKLASRGALRSAMEKADPVLLEPVMDLEVYVDDQYLGDVLSDLSSRRGRVQGQEPVGGGIQLIKAQVPQSELLRYSIDLKSITSGTAFFEMSFSHYSPITGKTADDVIKASQAEQESQ